MYTLSPFTLTLLTLVLGLFFFLILLIAQFSHFSKVPLRAIPSCCAVALVTCLL